MTIIVISMIRDPWGGSEELWYQMALEAMNQGHQVIHLGYEHPNVHPKMRSLVLKGMMRLPRPGYLPPDVTGFSRLALLGRNYLRKRVHDPIARIFSLKPDVILYNGTCYSIAHESALLRQLRAHPSFKGFHLLGHLNHDLLRNLSEAEAERVRWAYNRSREVFFVSRRNLETAKRQLTSEIPNAHIVRNPVNINSTELMELPANPIYQFASVANLVTQHKGQDLLLEAFSRIRTGNWHLNIFGLGYDESYLRKLSQHLGIDRNVSFHGTVANVRKIWADNQALVLSSHMEGMPLAVVEAMLCGRVCIATDVGGNAEWIEHGKSGFIAPSASVKALTQTLELSISRFTDWPEIGRNAHQRALNLYDAQAGSTLLRRIIAP